MELWDIYDKDRNVTGKTMRRGEAFEKDSYHLVVHICMFNKNGEMLVQQRQPFKKGWPNMWDVSVGGSAVAGDTSQQAAEREVLEELGYKVDLRGVRPSLTINFDVGFDDYYLIEVDLDIRELMLQEEEVKQVKWATKEEIMTMIHQDVFIPYHKSLIELLFDMRKYKGSNKRNS